MTAQHAHRRSLLILGCLAEFNVFRRRLTDAAVRGWFYGKPGGLVPIGFLSKPKDTSHFWQRNQTHVQEYVLYSTYTDSVPMIPALSKQKDEQTKPFYLNVPKRRKRR